MANAEQRLAHMVFFSLKEPSAENQNRLIASCRKYIAHQQGLLHFSVGLRGREFQRPVNDQEYDVGLHLVFASAQEHDRYQEDPDHLQFIAENKDTWASVRICDTYIDPA